MTQPQYSESAPAPVENVSVWEDFMDIFYAPAQVFRRRENGNWFIPMLVATIAISVCTAIAFNSLHTVYDPLIDRTVAAQMQANPRITPDMAGRVRRGIELSIQYGTIVGIPILIVVVAFVSWGLGRMFGSRQTLKSALVVAAYAQMARVVGAIIMVAQALLLDTSKMSGMDAISLGPLRFVNGESYPLLVHALLSRLDVFTIWATILIAIGLHVTGRISKGTAAAVAALVWIIGVLPIIKNLSALRQVSG